MTRTSPIIMRSPRNLLDLAPGCALVRKRSFELGVLNEQSHLEIRSISGFVLLVVTFSFRGEDLQGGVEGGGFL